MKIEGQLLELNIKNGNGWGISESEVNNLLTSLPGAPLKLCKDAAHGCDYNWNPNSQIGEIVRAERIGNWIHTKAEVTDPEVQKNLIKGSLSKNWSIFAGYQDKINDMLQGTKALSVTLVKNPAYKTASFRIGAAQEELEKGRDDLDNYYRGEKPKAYNSISAKKLAESLYRLEHMCKK